MYVYIYVYMYICMNEICEYICIYANMYTCIYVSCLYVYVYIVSLIDQFSQGQSGAARSSQKALGRKQKFYDDEVYLKLTNSARASQGQPGAARGGSGQKTAIL